MYRKIIQYFKDKQKKYVLEHITTASKRAKEPLVVLSHLVNLAIKLLDEEHFRLNRESIVLMRGGYGGSLELVKVINYTIDCITNAHTIKGVFLEAVNETVFMSDYIVDDISIRRLNTATKALLDAYETIESPASKSYYDRVTRRLISNLIDTYSDILQNHQ